MEYPPSSPHLIKLTDAARFLGYQSTQPIKKLISEKFLQEYKLPDSQRVLVDKIELESLLKPFEIITVLNIVRRKTVQTIQNSE